MQQIEQGEKNVQTPDVRRLIRNRYPEKDLYTVIRDVPQGLDRINVRTVSERTSEDFSACKPTFLRFLGRSRRSDQSDRSARSELFC